MTTNAKKLKIIKMVAESDETGIEKICEKLFGSSNDTNTTNANGLTRHDFMDAFACAFADEACENPELIMVVDVFGYLASKAADKLKLK